MLPYGDILSVVLSQFSRLTIGGHKMNKLGAVAFSILAVFLLIAPHAGSESELQPVVGLYTFGGAERGNEFGLTSPNTSSTHFVPAPAGGIGGTEVFGLYPLTKTWGIQGSLLNQGGRGGYRLGVSAGPVYAYGSGKVGLFTDYIYQNSGGNNFVYLRGLWSHYFQNWDLVFSYSQPVNSVQHDIVTIRSPEQNRCERFPPPRKKAVPAINQLTGFVRIYPTEKSEFTLGLLVNSFAGSDRNKTGTGFGGVFGAAVQLTDWLLLRPVQGQMDTRERYRITSGLQFIWTPGPKEKPERLLGEDRDTNFALASAGSAAITSPL
jgi:hypothetical protein